MHGVMAESEIWLRWLCSAGLAYIALQDLRHFRIPDHATLPLALLGLGRAVMVQPERTAELLGAGLVAGAVFWGLSAGYAVLRGREGLGLGDVKLAAVMGLWLGYGTGLAVMLGCALGLAVYGVPAALGRRPAGAPLPLGAMLAAGAVALLFFPGLAQIEVA